MCILPIPAAAGTAPAPPRSCPAQQLGPQQRQQLAVAALTGQSVSQLARQHRVSRKFVYQQRHRARCALDRSFTPPPTPTEPVLFTLPVTRAWLRQFILALVLVGHSPFRGVQAIAQDLLDYPLSLGTIHNVVRRAVPSAQAINARQDLSPIRIGAHDELFQNQRPVLVGADTDSSYCYLLRQESQRDAATWAIHLWDLQRQGFDPHELIADGGKGLRAGQQLACPGVRCRSDVFHVLRDFGHLVRFLENRAYRILEAREASARGRRSPGPAAPLPPPPPAPPEAEQAVALADDVAVLERWLREDILAVAGPPLADRQLLFDWLVTELRQREAQCPHRLRPVRSLLTHQRDDLLAFVGPLDQDIQEAARYHGLAPQKLRELLAVEALPWDSAQRWQRTTVLRSQLGARWREVEQTVRQLARSVVRASSVIENLNSRLRGYFFLRRQLGPEYLELLRFFLNHRRFPRSEQERRVGKSPAELLSGQAHSHWLELLGYRRFRRSP